VLKAHKNNPTVAEAGRPQGTPFFEKKKKTQGKKKKKKKNCFKLIGEKECKRKLQVWSSGGGVEKFFKTKSAQNNIALKMSPHPHQRKKKEKLGHSPKKKKPQRGLGGTHQKEPCCLSRTKEKKEKTCNKIGGCTAKPGGGVWCGGVFCVCFCFVWFFGGEHPLPETQVFFGFVGKTHWV